MTGYKFKLFKRSSSSSSSKINTNASKANPSANDNASNSPNSSPSNSPDTNANPNPNARDHNSNSHNSNVNRKRSSTYPSTKPFSNSSPSTVIPIPLSSSATEASSAMSSASPPPPSSSSPSPLRRSPSPPPKNRARLNSREIPRTYSGLYGIGGGHELTHQTQTPSSDLLPFELSRNNNSNWLYSYPSADLHHNNTNHLRNNIMSSSLFWIYIFFIVFVQFALLVLPLPFLQHHVEISFTCTHILHGIITLLFLHWLKGSPNYYDNGELNALTLWEQLSCSPESNQMATQTKQVLVIIPTLLCYISCKFVNFDAWISLLNLGVWIICVVAKMEGMHGVRLFGLNRTIGIDDDVRKRK